MSKSKCQIKSQAPNPKFGHWNLRFYWKLDIGIWKFE